MYSIIAKYNKLRILLRAQSLYFTLSLLLLFISGLSSMVSLHAGEFNHSGNTKQMVSKKVTELPNGDLYSGDLKYGLIREGYGVNQWPNGDQYKGEWLNDSPHGKGSMLRNNKDEYYGTFAFGQYSGLGDLKTQSGERYLGNFRFNQLDGLGLFISVNKEYYLGEFSQQKRHGRFLYFSRLSARPEYQIWFNDALEKVIEVDDSRAIIDEQERQLITQMLERFSLIAKQRLNQRRANTHYQIRGKVRKIVSDVDVSPAHAYGDIIINLLSLSE